MLIIGIDPGISGSICFLKDGKILDVVEMPTMIDGKKNKKQVNGSQIFNEISKIINETGQGIPDSEIDKLADLVADIWNDKQKMIIDLKNTSKWKKFINHFKS